MRNLGPVKDAYTFAEVAQRLSIPELDVYGLVACGELRATDTIDGGIVFAVDFSAYVWHFRDDLLEEIPALPEVTAC
jgi:hypothetical protein